MNNLYGRSVFFVENAERALRFYVDRLGFSEDWNYQGVCQVALLGFELHPLGTTDVRDHQPGFESAVFLGPAGEGPDCTSRSRTLSPRCRSMILS